MEATTNRIDEEPETTTKITRTVVTSEQPAEETKSYYTKKVTTTTTTTRGNAIPSNQTNVTRYSNTTGGNRNQSNTTSSYTRPGAQTNKTTTTSQYNRYGQNNPNTNTNSQVYRGNQRNVNPPKVIGNSKSYSENKYQPKKPQTNSSYNRPKSTQPGSLQKKTINRGNPVENVQITHIILTSRPIDFHITEDLDLENLNTNPIQISKADRAKLQKTGKVTTKCSCDGVDIAQPKKANLIGKTTVYQHARGIGMTNDKENVNPMFYSSEIKTLEPIYKKKEKEKLENIENFRSSGKVYNNTATTKKTTTTTTKTSTYNRGGMNNTNSQKRNYATGSTNSGYNRGGVGSSTKTTTTAYRGSNMDGRDGEIIKETNTRVQMGSRSQYNQTKPTTYTTSERKVYNQRNFFNK